MRTAFLLFLILASNSIYSKEKTICLNMIVKDERHVIEECLSSVKPLIDYWVIVDTGSSDGTQAFIKEFMSDIPGELHERPWVNFSYNRNEALNLAKNKSDYTFFIDADDTLKVSSDFILPSLTLDYYSVPTKHSQLRYKRIHLIKSDLDWKWVGVLHEYISSSQAQSFATLEGLEITYNGTGARSKDSQKFQKDIQVFEKALLEEPDNSRYVFYLAQSYRDAGNYQEALYNYEKRISMGGWYEEVFWSMLRIALIQQQLKLDSKVIVDSYNRAYQYRPNRAEPLYYLANYYFQTGNYAQGYLTAKKGLHLSLPTSDICFIEPWIYEYGLLLEFSLNAYYSGHYTESFLASKIMLADPKLPSNIRTCVEKNMLWINSKLNQPDHK